MGIETVDYTTLDAAKAKFIAASQRTLSFAGAWGSIVNTQLGASANVLSLDLSPWIAAGAKNLSLSLVPEGLGTADDARPSDLSSAELTEFWFEIGIKTVAVITNDAASAGLQTVAIGLYLPSARPEVVFSPEFLSGFLDGFVAGCKTVGCVYISGETPQLKGKMLPEALDIAGACVALALPDRPALQTTGVSSGNSIVLVESSGPHENGFTTLRAIAETVSGGYRAKVDDAGTPFWRAINKGSKLYTPLIQEILKRGISPTNLENITGHGWQKIMRSSAALRYEITDPLPLPPLFKFIERELKVDRSRLLTLFNCGAGFALFLETSDEAKRCVTIANELGLRATVAGQVHADATGRKVTVPVWNAVLDGETFALKK